MPKVSLIISFYNKIDYLKLVLAGLEKQSFRDFEIILADDGSSENIIEEIERISLDISFPLTHLWQEDNGFRKNRILNKAIRSAETNYLIFIDGDCVPHPEFINEHYSNRKENVCLTGRRVNLSKKFTDSLNPQNIKEGRLQNLLFLILDGVFGGSYDVEKGFYFKNNFLRKKFNKKKRGILGCNFSLHKKDIEAINGFDERYEAPSIGEDSDVQFRLELNGTRIGSLNNIAVQYHLYHELQERPKKNLDLFDHIKNEKKIFTPYGIVKTEN